MGTLRHKIIRFFSLVSAALFIALVLSALIMPATFRVCATDENTDVRTLSFDVDIDVRENNSFYVTERISVEFLKPSSGIVRDIWLRGEVRINIEDKYEFRDIRFRISRIDVEGGPFKTYREDNGFFGKQFIDIGDPKALLEGRHDYVISYLLDVDESGGKGGLGGIDGGKDNDSPSGGDVLYFDGEGGMSYDKPGDPLADRDFIRLDVIPQSWPSAIDSVNIRITFPADADVSNAVFSVHQFGGSDDDTDMMDIELLWPDAEGKYTIAAQSLRPVNHDEGMVFQVILPEGYFVTQRYFSPAETAFFVVVFAAPLLCLLIWFLFGRNRSIVETVELRPPAGLTPAEIGLFWNGKLRDRDLYSMFIYWAGRGALDIEETSDRDYRLHRKTEELPAGSKDFEKNMFDRIFDSEDRISMKASALRAGKAMHGARDEILREYKKEHKTLYEKRSLSMRLIALVIAFLPIVFNSVFAIGLAPWQFDFGELTPILFLMCLSFLLVMPERGRVPSGKATFRTLIVDALRSPVVFVSVFVIIMNGIIILETPLHAILASVSTVICLVFAVMTRKKTEFYSRLLGQIRGFANFIRTAETDRIKMLADEDPDYFFDILPYAWAMELTDEWDDKFNRFGLTIMPPNVFLSSPRSIIEIENIAARRNVSSTSPRALTGKDRTKGLADMTTKMNKARSLASFTVRRKGLDIGMSVALFLALAGLFIWEIFRFRQTLIDGSPFPDMSHFQAANTEFWASQIAGFVMFLVIMLAGLYYMLITVCRRVHVEGDTLTIYSPFRKKIQMHIGEISGVDIRNDTYVLMRGTKAIAKVKPSDTGFHSLMVRLGLAGI